MESADGDQRVSVKEELFRSPRQFSFEMVAYILNCNVSISFGREISVESAAFKTMSIIAFHLRGTEIEKIEDGVQPIVFLSRLALAGLNAPLPTPYADLAIRRAHERDYAISAFFNIFNSRLLGISYRISQRRYFTLQQNRWPMQDSVSKFFGEKRISRKLTRLAYLFWSKERSAEGLRILIEGYFHLKAQVCSLYDYWEVRQGISLLGNNYLNENAYLGTRVSLRSFGVKICITHDNRSLVFDFISNSAAINELKFLARKYLGPLIICRLEFYPSVALELKFGKSLGVNTWFKGDNADPISMYI